MRGLSPALLGAGGGEACLGQLRVRWPVALHPAMSSRHPNGRRGGGESLSSSIATATPGHWGSPAPTRPPVRTRPPALLPAKAPDAIHHEPHPPLLLRLGRDVADAEEQGQPQRRGREHLPPQGPGPRGPGGGHGRVVPGAGRAVSRALSLTRPPRLGPRPPHCGSLGSGRHPSTVTGQGSGP